MCIQGYTFDKVLNVIDADISEKAQGIKNYQNTQELLKDVLPYSKYRLEGTWAALRREILIKDNVEMILLCNEGQQRIDTWMEIPQDIRYISMNLWSGEYRCEESQGKYHVQLAPLQMQLLILDKACEMPLKRGVQKLDIGDRTGDFTLLSKENNRAEYVWKYDTDVVNGSEEFSICGEEMAECWCNGVFVGMSLYAPHRFMIGPYLHEGENEIKVVFTGSAANVYADAGIPYGIAGR